jgi:hypothetical protein
MTREPVNTQIQQLSVLRREVLGLPPEKALEKILDAPQPAALVHSFPEADLHFLIHDIGPDDALPILSLASDRQWQYLLDVETWQRDLIDTRSLSRWFYYLITADPQRFVSRFLDSQLELVEFFLYQNIDVAIREHDEDASEFREAFETSDETYWVRVRSQILDQETDGSIREQHQEFIQAFIQRLSNLDHLKYQQILMESRMVLPAEFQEEAFRWRNIRLAEKGFLPFDEAMGIYQPLKPDAFGKTSRKILVADHSGLPVPLMPMTVLKPGSLFADALRQIDSPSRLEQLETEFAGLGNQVAAADQKIIRTKDALTQIVAKAAGYLSLGLTRLSRPETKHPVQEAARLIETYPLADIFRVGYGLALGLKWEADRWKKQAWSLAGGRPLSFWGEFRTGLLGGLFLKRPMFFDNYQTGALYREFATLDDIQSTEKGLRETMAIDDLLSRMAVELPVASKPSLSWKNLLLTLWSRHCLKMEETAAPVSLETFRPFFDNLWTVAPRRIRTEQKEAFLDWLSQKSGLDTYRISQSLGAVLEALFSQIEAEYGAVTRLDPRFISLFLLKK